MEGLILAYQAFVHLVAEYGNVLMMGASATQLSNWTVCSTLLSRYALHSLYFLKGVVMST